MAPARQIGKGHGDSGMVVALRIPELSRRDRFIRRAVAERTVYAGLGDGGLVSVPSPRARDRLVSLFWSSRGDAERWTPVLEAGASIEPIPLGVLAGEIANGLAERGMLAGIDWNVDPLEVEIEPADLVARLQLEAVESFIAALGVSRTVWVLEDADGPAVMPSLADAAQVLLPVWTDRAAAESRIVGEWSDSVALEITLDSFVTMTLPWLVEQGWRLAPSPWDGGLGPDIGPSELGARLASRGRAA